MRRPILCVDFDGVIHRYSRGWKDGAIYDGIVPGFFEWAYAATKVFRLVIYSSRSKTQEGREAMGEWLFAEWLAWRNAKLDAEPASGPRNMRVLYRMESTDWLLDKDEEEGFLTLEMAHEKPPAFWTIDDRCTPFAGRWDDLALAPEVLIRAKTWSQMVENEDFGK